MRPMIHTLFTSSIRIAQPRPQNRPKSPAALFCVDADDAEAYACKDDGVPAPAVSVAA
jgi:hypothetical protein